MAGMPHTRLMVRTRSPFRVAVERVADVVIRGSGLLGVLRQLDTLNGQILRVLAYHRVADPARDTIQGDPSIISATPETFADQVRLLVQHYVPIGLPDLEALVRGAQPIPRRAVLVTFDDGYRDFLLHAWPVLKKHSVPVVLFVPTAYPGRKRLFWWDELWRMFSRATAPSAFLPGLGRVDLGTPRTRWGAMVHIRKEMRFLPSHAVQQRMTEFRAALGVEVESTSVVLSWEELRTLSREGVTIASHGRSHASMPSLTETEIAEEIDGAQVDMEQELGAVARVFAYPFGHYDARVASVLRGRGFLAAFRTGPGHNAIPLGNPFAIFRHTVNAGHSPSRLQLGLSGLYPKPLTRLSYLLRGRGS